MKRSEKEVFVSELSKSANDAEVMALMSFEKITVEQMTDFRLSLKKQGLKVKVVKNTLAKRAFQETPHKGLVERFTGPTLMIFGSRDPVISAKVVFEWVDKENFRVQVRGGVALGNVMEAEQLLALSKLPGKKELFTGFLWALKSGPTKFLYALQDGSRKLGYALGALKAKKENES